MIMLCETYVGVHIERNFDGQFSDIIELIRTGRQKWREDSLLVKRKPFKVEHARKHALIAES